MYLAVGRGHLALSVRLVVRKVALIEEALRVLRSLAVASTIEKSASVRIAIMEGDLALTLVLIAIEFAFVGVLRRLEGALAVPGAETLRKRSK